MGKQLIGRENVEQFVCRKSNKFYMDHSLILSPGAKDYLQEAGIAIVYDAKIEQVASANQPVPDSQPEGMGNEIKELLRSEYAITDAAQIEEITSKVLQKYEELK